jgi:hypothetical protein
MQYKSNFFLLVLNLHFSSRLRRTTAKQILFRLVFLWRTADQGSEHYFLTCILIADRRPKDKSIFLQLAFFLADRGPQDKSIIFLACILLADRGPQDKSIIFQHVFC